MKNKDVWIVIPAHNEGKHISELIKALKKGYDNIVVVDDGSSDDTYMLAKDLGVHALRHIINMGKGAALKTGCDFAVKEGASTIVVMDADGQHNPSDIPRLLEKIDGNDICFGYRSFDTNMPIVFRLGNMVINTVMRALFGIKLKDTQCGFRLFKSSIYRKIRWSSADYSMESEMIANVGRNRLRYCEVAIKTIYSDRYKGTTILDGLKIVFNMFWWRLSR